MHQAGHRLRVVAAAGIGPENGRGILEVTGARDLHLSAGRRETSPVWQPQQMCALGAADLLAESELVWTDGACIRELLAALS